MLIGATSHPSDYYRPDGRHKGTVNQILHPINHGTLAFCGFNVHEPFIAMDIMSNSANVREKILKDLEFRMQNLVASPQWLVFYN